MSARCPICGGVARGTALVHRDGHLARCLRCGLVSVDPLPARDVALAQYDAAYFAGDAGYRDYASEERHFRREFRRRLRRIRAAGGRGRLFDVGAATGAFLLEARDAGFAVAGVEPADAVASRARARGLDVATGTAETFERAPGSVDVLTCSDVLEHLVDPVAALRRFRAALAPDGLLVLSVPDFGGLWARASGARWPFVTPREHLHYFTRRTLRRALEVAGFVPSGIGLAGTPVSLGSLARRLPGRSGVAVERRLGRRADAGLALPFGTLFAVARLAEAALNEGPGPPARAEPARPSRSPAPPPRSS